MKERVRGGDAPGPRSISGPEIRYGGLSVSVWTAIAATLPGEVVPVVGRDLDDPGTVADRRARPTG